MINYAAHVAPTRVPQTEKLLGRNQVKNNAGGYVFEVDCWKRLDRFLTIGNEGGTYYVGEAKLTKENAECILECADKDHKRAVNRVVELSTSGRIPRNDTAVFALALLSSFSKSAPYALKHLNEVCRIGTHLFQFVEAVKSFRGWGRSLKNAVANWYLSKTPQDLSYQLVKYQQRNGWSHRDLIRLSHPKTDSCSLNDAFKWAVGKWDKVEVVDREDLSPILGFEQSKKADDKQQIISLITDFNLPRECIPTKFLNDKEVWAALLEKMPMTAMIRNLGKMSNVGLLTQFSDAAGSICERLVDVDRLKKAYIHPLSVLLALKTYQSGHGFRGSLSWKVIPQISDALNEAFYKAFTLVKPTNKRWVLGVDVSGSMGSLINNTNLSCAEVAAALSMVTVRTEKNYCVWGFADKMRELNLNRSMSLEDVLSRTRRMNFGATDCALPMITALKAKLPVDVFVVLTDSETWMTNVHPCIALREYRQKMSIPAKLVVMSMTGTDYTIADPNDGGTLDISGFDSSVPSVLRDFVGES